MRPETRERIRYRPYQQWRPGRFFSIRSQKRGEGLRPKSQVLPRRARTNAVYAAVFTRVPLYSEDVGKHSRRWREAMHRLPACFPPPSAKHWKSSATIIHLCSDIRAPRGWAVLLIYDPTKSPLLFCHLVFTSRPGSRFMTRYHPPPLAPPYDVP